MTSPDTKSMGILILDLSASRTRRNKYLFHKPFNICIAIAVQTETIGGVNV